MFSNKMLLLVSGFLLCCAFGVQAQNELPDEQVEVIKNFDARLLDAEMLKIDPQLPPTDTTTKRQTYNLPNRSITVEYLPPKIRPLAMKREKLEEMYNGYAKLGAGLPSSFYGEFGYNILKDKQFDFDIQAKHHSANNKKIDHQRFSDNYGKVSGTYYFEEGFAVNGRLGYQRDYVYYYGYNFDEAFKDTFLTKDEVQQRFSIFDIGATIFNGEQTAGDVNYNAGVDFYYMEDNYSAREHGFDLNLNFTKWFSEKHPLSIKLRTDFNQYRDSISQDLNNFYLQPNFTFHHDYFRVKVGVNLTSHEDEYRVFPDVEAAVPLLGSRLTLFAGAQGSLQKNTLRTLAAYNPFVSSYGNIVPENTAYFDYFGGLKGTYRGVEYQGRVGYRQSENMALFVPNYEEFMRTIVPYDFNVLYDDVDLFYISGSLNAPLFRGLSVVGTVTSNVFDPAIQEAAWHLPALTFQGTIKYLTLENKATIRASCFVESGVSYPTADGEKEKLNGLFDISVGAEYQFLENFGVFVDVYNLANNKRRRWYNYPTFGLNALLGVTARF